MNDTQITDDLLEELEELESSAAQLDKQVSDTQAKKTTLDKLDSPSTIDATSLALEAAKTAQEAADQSQKAAEASLNHSNRQKEQIMELSDANFSWRQAVKSANKEIKSARTTFAIMLSVSVITSLIAMSVLGWLFYSMHKKETAFKSEILDILQTENALLTKQITVKVDELSALIEFMTADIQKISKLGVAIQANTSGQSTVPMQDTTTPEMDTQTEPSAMPIIDLASEAAPDDKNYKTSAVTHDTHTDKQPHVDVKPDSHSVLKAEHPAETTLQVTPTMAAGLSNEHYAEIKVLIEKILAEQNKLQAKTLAPTATSSGAGLSAQQEKQLKDIGWLVRKQTKTLEQIQKTIGQQPVTSNSKQLNASTKQAQQTYKAIQGSLIELKDQLGKLQAQQNQLQSQVDGLQKETKILSDAAKPYSYKLKQ
ncbi:MAG: hypothetical protein U9R28_03675 [Pseudomonadota bacterium]|nr:hypothetical protein [Pseudomonadota bacterium]